MSGIARKAWGSLWRFPAAAGEREANGWMRQQWRGIRVKVVNGNLDQALARMQRAMTSSGMERLIRSQQTRHLKNSEKRILARKNLERKIRSQDLARKLQSILAKKVRGL
ncbi:hypothetical protein Tsubulata_021226 [Turnera subulata]|uniref:Ribosomal protein S21 n=1 Tax=Turnera subulata TaxID=218843 RepID=A0A9Q0FN91_9ROSI|nr:hypothetical protein Tsubulata_021226 [Turnera subulata]